MNQEKTKELLSKFVPIVVSNSNFNLALIQTQLDWIGIKPKTYQVIKYGLIGQYDPLWLELQENVEEIYFQSKLPLVILSEVDISDETGGELLTKIVTNYKEGGVVVEANSMLYDTKTIEEAWDRIGEGIKGRWLFTNLDTPNELVMECLEHYRSLNEDTEVRRVN